MSLTLKSLQTEMRSGFAETSLRIDNLDSNLNERVDRIVLRLDTHIKETASNFREVDRRFNEVDRRFDEVDRRFDKQTSDILDEVNRRLDKQTGDILDEVNRRLNKQTGDIVGALFPFFENLENSLDSRLNNHEDRICILEKKL